MGLKKNSPGCGCCGTTCPDVACGDGSSGQVNQVTWSITGIPATLNYWHFDGSFWNKVEITGVDTANGSHVATRGADCEFNTFPRWEGSYIETVYDGCPGNPLGTSASTPLWIQIVIGLSSSTIDHEFIIRFTESGNPGTEVTISGTTQTFPMQYKADGAHNRCGTTNLIAEYPTSIDGVTCAAIIEDFSATAVSSA